MIFHIDLDCYYCSAERVRNKALRGIPIAVGGGDRTSKLFAKKAQNLKVFQENQGAFVRPVYHSSNSLVNQNAYRGIVVTSSYEARAKGVKTAMSINEALKLCPNLTVIPPDHLYYHKLSVKLHLLLQELIPVVEQASIDEFYCDISGLQEAKNPQKFALHVKEIIEDKLSLPLSIGIAHTKRIAKLATNDAKPNGIRYVRQEEVIDFVRNKPIKDFPGLGKSFEKKLLSYGIRTLGEALGAKHLFQRWGNHATELYLAIQGQDRQKVNPESKRKSIGISRTFEPEQNREEIQRRVLIFARHLTFMVKKLGLHPASFYLKIRYTYGLKEEARHTEYRLFHEKMLKEIMLRLYKKSDTHPNLAITFLYMSVNNFIEHNKKSVSLLDFEEDKKQNLLQDSLYKIRQKYGLDAIKGAKEI